MRSRSAPERPRAGLAAAAAAGLLASLAGAEAALGAEHLLPRPQTGASGSVERALAARRSVRAFRSGPISLAQAGQLLWAAQGLTGAQGRRAAPSAGALYPLRLYLAAGAVEGLAPGLYRYEPQSHALALTSAGDARRALAAASGQAWIAGAPAVVLFAADPRRTAGRYGARADRFVQIEAGAAAENLSLQAVALGLGSTFVGAFDEAALQRSVALAPGERPVLLLPLGRPATDPGR
jgi:SagB-type dehydrogenase family enzyme